MSPCPIGCDGSSCFPQRSLLTSVSRLRWVSRARRGPCQMSCKIGYLRRSIRSSAHGCLCMRAVLWHLEKAQLPRPSCLQQPLCSALDRACLPEPASARSRQPYRTGTDYTVAMLMWECRGGWYYADQVDGESRFQTSMRRRKVSRSLTSRITRE